MFELHLHRSALLRSVLPPLCTLAAILLSNGAAPAQSLRELLTQSSDRQSDDQERAPHNSFGVSTSFSLDSSHILIGEANQRRTFTLGFEFTHQLHAGRQFHLDYEGSVLPVYLESDPTVTSTYTTIAGRTYVNQVTPVRVVSVTGGPVGYVNPGSPSVAPIYATYSRQTTYAAALLPLGIRLSLRPRHRIQPSFSINTGFVVSARDLPIDGSDQFNYLFAFGPGLEIYSSRRSSFHIDYIYRHISNAGEGAQNPGVDQGIFRVTLSRHK